MFCIRLFINSAYFIKHRDKKREGFFMFISNFVKRLSSLFNSYTINNLFKSNPGSSVGSDACCQSRNCEFESRLGQLSFRGLTKVNATCAIRLPLMGKVYVEKQPVALEDCCVEYWCEKTRKCMST